MSKATARKPTAPIKATPVRAVVQPLALQDRLVSRVSGSARELNGILRLLTCGSVDDGKSTLIGRLLWDASDLYDDQRATIERSASQGGAAGQPDFSLLVDGLAAEREQGITIDIAWRYFDTERRRFVVIDSPGHEQYTRNMASGASHADVAIMLVDARSGIKTQTRRHAAILDLVGVKRVVLAVNKMDLVDWDEEPFQAIARDFAALAAKFGFAQAVAIPLAARSGDNVASASERMPWYSGPTLLEHLDGLPSRVTQVGGHFRFPVQTVLRDGQDFRGLAGTVASGSVCVGDRIVDVISGQSSRVLRIATMGRDLEIASAGQAVALQLEHDLDLARGAILAGPGTLPTAATRLETKFVWMADAPFDPKGAYFLRTATDLVPVAQLAIDALLDLETLTTRPATGCAMNDIALATLTLGRPTAVDRFTTLPETGSFMLVDALTGASVAGGVIVEARALGVLERSSGDTDQGFVLTREMLASGLCAGLAADGVEFERRAQEAIRLLALAGVTATLKI
jgi:bifunctional enzyme CysN/CysC